MRCLSATDACYHEAFRWYNALRPMPEHYVYENLQGDIFNVSNLTLSHFPLEQLRDKCFLCSMVYYNGGWNVNGSVPDSSSCFSAVIGRQSDVGNPCGVVL